MRESSRFRARVCSFALNCRWTCLSLVLSLLQETLKLPLAIPVKSRGISAGLSEFGVVVRKEHHRHQSGHCVVDEDIDAEPIHCLGAGHLAPRVPSRNRSGNGRLLIAAIPADRRKARLLEGAVDRVPELRVVSRRIYASQDR